MLKKCCFVYMVIIFVAMITCTNVAGKIIYVDADAPGPVGDGSSWTDAYVFLQHALGDASTGDEIRVAQGTYRPNEGILAVPEIDWRTVTFQLINNVVVEGGYAGYGESDPNERNIEIYETILSGDLDGDDVGDLDDPSRNENSYHVVTGSGTNATACLDGFTIIGGNANGSYPDYHGGGMYNDEGDPVISNCKFSSNSAERNGGGIYNNENNPTLANCAFIGNSARSVS